MDKQMIFWAVVFVVAVLIEFASLQLVSIWFAAGALGAFIASFFQPFGVQLAVFIIITGVSLIATRPLIKKIRRPAVPTNHELDLGQMAVVIEDIVPAAGTGRVRIKGVDWSAVSSDGSTITAGETVTITQISGARVTVELQRNTDIRKEMSC